MGEQLASTGQTKIQYTSSRCLNLSTSWDAGSLISTSRQSGTIVATSASVSGSSNVGRKLELRIPNLSVNQGKDNILEMTAEASAGTVDITVETKAGEVLAGKNRGFTCKEVLDINPAAGSGVYELDLPPPQIGTWHTYCEMGLDGGGWTMLAKAIKTDSSSSTMQDLNKFKQFGTWKAYTKDGIALIQMDQMIALAKCSGLPPPLVRSSCPVSLEYRNVDGLDTRLPLVPLAFII